MLLGGLVAHKDKGRKLGTQCEGLAETEHTYKLGGGKIFL